jgi:AcrR family transcriptional regulator
MTNPRATRRPNQLPPGRHGLARSFVARNQRERILAAVAEAAQAHGFARMSVQDIVTEAGVSRRTFYEQFKNKDDAFIAAFDEAAGRLVSLVRAAFEQESTFADRVTSGFQTFLEVLAGSPAFARMCIVEVLAAGPEAISRRNKALDEFARVLEENARDLLGNDAPPALIAETIVGGMYELVYRRIARGETGGLPDLLPDLVESALLPYVGEKKASAQARALRER